ncbi:MAG: 4'-phosphopantetheinyl transferase superfamily protein [Oscillospiraceae bacterium]|nr:4'-phosphopantetheinyl transferase superfamily protein [Oscillospiraceae bacterium]
MIKVYAMNVSGIDISDSRLTERMSPRRMEKINRIRVEKTKKQSIGAELLLNYALKRECQIEPPVIWETDENGKLFVPDCAFNVNLSHSDDYAVCAVSDTAVGVDIQKIKPADKALAKRFFTSDEYEYVLNARNAEDAFFRIWVRKESFIKAVGKGLAIPLSSFSVLGETAEYEGKVYKFKEYSVRDRSYKLCVCFML